MQFELLTTLYSEINANLLKGLLSSEGIEVRINDVTNQPRPYSMRSDTFGIYVKADEMNKAKSILTSFEKQIAVKKYPIVLKVYALIILFALLAFALASVYQKFY